MSIYENRVCRSQRRTVIIIVLLIYYVDSYEKTLRKIVRDQYKMVQKPFSASDPSDLVWRNYSHPRQSRAYDASDHPGAGGGRANTLYYSKLVPLLHANDSDRVIPSYFPSVNQNKIPAPDSISPVGFNVSVPLALGTHPMQHQNIDFEFVDNEAMQNQFQMAKGNGMPFTSNNNDISLSAIQKSAIDQANFVAYDNIDEEKNMTTLMTHRVFVHEPTMSSSLAAFGDVNVSLVKQPAAAAAAASSALEHLVEAKADFIIEEIPAADRAFSYNVSGHPYFCSVLPEAKADINAQEKFLFLDIDPRQPSKKTFWNHIFETRYESLMRNPKWPPLKVILIPRAQVDSIWRKSFEQYHNNHVQKILTNIVKKMQFYKNLTFSWNEVSHLSTWWTTTTQKNRAVFRRLVRSGRLEIANGFWVEADEATTHTFALVHQLIEGHQWLKENLNVSPKVGWLTNSVTHSPTIPYLLSAADINYLVITNLHFAWQKYFAEYQYSDFVWVQNWDTKDTILPTDLNKLLLKIGSDRLPEHSVLTHYLQFNSAGFRACGPHRDICANEFNFAKAAENTDINMYNVKEKAELLLEQYSKTGTTTTHNVIIAPIGGPYRYESLTEFDYQYNNYQKLADYINSNKDVYKASIEFGTASDYFKILTKKHKKFPTLKGDFPNFADLESGTPAYWAGFFTSRPLLKIFIRRLQSNLRTAEILFTFAASYGCFMDFNVTEISQLLESGRVRVARLSDRHVSSGTLSAHAMKHALAEVVQAARDCWRVQEVTASLLTARPGRNLTYLTKYVYRDGELISLFRSVVPGDQIYVFNSLTHERTEIVELITKNPNIRITDHAKKFVTIQINPVWKYSGGDAIVISQRYYKIVFAIVLPPLTFELFKIKETTNAMQHAATIFCSLCEFEDNGGDHFITLFKIQPVEPGDIQIENYKHRLIFDEITGFMKTVIEKETNIEKTVTMNYGVFRSSNVNSGMFLFNTNSSQPIDDTILYKNVKRKHIIIVSGYVTTEFSTCYGKLLQHSIRIFNLVNSPLSGAIYLESKVDFETSPKYRENEMYLSIQTDISNGNPPQIVTDNNGFQYTSRILNITRNIESNVYPMTSMVFMEDRRSRLTVVTEHAQGVTALHEGQLLVLLDRRVLFADGRGVAEGLADSRYTCHRHYILLENFIEPLDLVEYYSVDRKLLLPSLSAIYLSNALNYDLDIFMIEKNKTQLVYHTFLPLVKTPFPCDVSLVTYRTLTRAGAQFADASTSALLVLHRQAFSCHLSTFIQMRCEGEQTFSLHNILRNSKIVYKTNLGGTSRGVIVNSLDKTNFGPMELITLKIHF